MSTNDPYTTPDARHETPYRPYAYQSPPPFFPQPTSGMAVASLVLGIVGVTIGWFLVGLPAFLSIIFGHIALGEVKKGKSGKGMAVAGLVLGYIVGSIMVIGIVAVAYGA